MNLNKEIVRIAKSSKTEHLLFWKFTPKTFMMKALEEEAITRRLAMKFFESQSVERYYK